MTADQETGGPGWQNLMAICFMCQEPGKMVDGVFMHDFTGKPECTYRSHL